MSLQCAVVSVGFFSPRYGERAALLRGEPAQEAREPVGDAVVPVAAAVAEPAAGVEADDLVVRLGGRRGELEEMHVRGEYTHARFNIPARGLIGLRTRMLNATQGTAVIHHRYAGYKPIQGEMQYAGCAC